MKTLPPAALAAAFLFLTTPAQAHHGQQFFLLYDAQVQQPGHGLLQGQFSFIDEGSDDSLSLSPNLNLGLLPRTGFNLRADFADDAGEGWAYRSIEPGFQFDLTPPNLKLPLRFGLSVAYQFAGSRSGGHPHGTASLSGGSVAHVHEDSPAAHAHPASAASAAPAHDHSTHDHNPPPVPQPGVDLGPDALTPEELAAMAAQNPAVPSAPPPASPAPAQKKSKPAPKPKSKSQDHAAHGHAEESGHSHSGSIHNHDDNLLTTRFIFEADLAPGTLLIGNLLNVIPESGESAWGYAIGLRQRLRPGLAVGVEALGDFDRSLHQEVLGAVFWEPIPHVLIKAGVGTGLNANSPDATVRAGILWMF